MAKRGRPRKPRNLDEAMTAMLTSLGLDEDEIAESIEAAKQPKQPRGPGRPRKHPEYVIPVGPARQRSERPRSQP